MSVIDHLPPSTPQEPNPESDRLARMQRKRAKYVERLGENPVIDLHRVTPGDTPIWSNIGRLRREVYVDEHHYLEPSVLDEEGREYDEYDEREDTIHICALSPEGEIVGYVRIVTKGENGEELLPAEKVFGVELEDNAVEITRLISKRGFPGAPLVTLSLIRAAMHELNSDPEKYGASVATLEPFLAAYLDTIGIPVETVVGIQETPEYNSSNMLVRMDQSKIVERATKVDRERKFSPVYPERLGPWFEEMKVERGLGRVALVQEKHE